MIFIIRTEADRVPALDIKMVRHTPGMVGNAPPPAGAFDGQGADGSANGPRRFDFFCLGGAKAAEVAGWAVVPVHDGWYADDGAGGMAIWGQGMFWEVRDTPFTVKQACGIEAWPPGVKHDQAADVNIRQAIFRG